MNLALTILVIVLVFVGLAAPIYWLYWWADKHDHMTGDAGGTWRLGKREDPHG